MLDNQNKLPHKFSSNFSENSYLAIFAGRGDLPKILIDDCLKKNRNFTLFLLSGENYDIDYSQFNPIQINYGEIERFLKIIHEKNIKNLVFIGAVNKPNFSQLKVDKTGAKLLAKIIANKILGDDAVLKTVIKFFEKNGLKIMRIDEILDCVISSPQILTKKHPTPENLTDIEIGTKAIHHFSKFDVGQSVVVSQKQIIAVEALEGTDLMIERCQKLHGDFTKNAVLIKRKKTHQTAKADLPTIGVKTIENCFNANIAGLAIQVNNTLILDKENVIKKADELGLFITAIK